MISFFISYFLFLRGKNSLGREQFISSHGSRKCCPWSPYPTHLGRASWWREQAVHRGTAPFMTGQQAERRGTMCTSGLPFLVLFSSGFGALRMVPLIFRAHISLSIIFFLEMLLQKHLEVCLSIILMTLNPVRLKNHD